MNTLSKQRRKSKPVTLIVGILCKDGIAMAGDSQTTYGSSKTWNTNKMTDIEHTDGHILIAESGADITSASIVSELRALIAKKAFLDENALPEFAETAVRKVRMNLRAQNFDCSSDELQNVIERNDLESELMIAHYLGNEPKIFTISLTTGISKKARESFETIGCGSELANYLLNESCPKDLDIPMAVVTAVHVVETVKRYDPYCGGPTRLGVLLPPRKAPDYLSSDFISIYTHWGGPIAGQDFTETIVNNVVNMEAALKEKRIEIMRAAMKIQTDELHKNLGRLVSEELRARNNSEN